MKLHFLSQGYGIGLAYQAHQNECKVSVFLRDATMGNGIVPKVATPKPPSRPDAVIVDGIGWAKQTDEFEKDGYRVLFGGKFAELLAAQPKLEHETMKRIGYKPGDLTTLDLEADRIVGGWFEDGFRAPYFAAIVHRRLMNDDIGAEANVIGVELVALPEEHPLIEEFILPATDTLRNVGYRGLVSVQIGGMDDLYVTGLHCGIHAGIIEALSEICYGGFPALVAEGGGSTSDDCAVYVGVTYPPYPFGVAKPKEAIRFAVSSQQAKHLWPIDVSKCDEGMEYHADCGFVCGITARGRPRHEEHERRNWFREAGWRALRTIRELGIPGAQYRTDIGKAGLRLEALLDTPGPAPALIPTSD